MRTSKPSAFLYFFILFLLACIPDVSSREVIPVVGWKKRLITAAVIPAAPERRWEFEGGSGQREAAFVMTGSARTHQQEAATSSLDSPERRASSWEPSPPLSAPRSAAAAAAGHGGDVTGGPTRWETQSTPRATERRPSRAGFSLDLRSLGCCSDETPELLQTSRCL